MTADKKRHVFFVGALKEGGAERVISILTKQLATTEKDVKIVLYHDMEPFYPIHPNIEILYAERETQSKNVFKNLLWLRRFFKKNADVVISFLAPFNMLALVAGFGLRTRMIVADRNDPRFVPSKKLLRILRDFLYRFADGVVLQTSNNQAYFSKTVQKKSAVIFNPIDLGEKKGLALRTEKHRKIVSVGRLMPQKNQIMLLRAFTEIHRVFPEYELFIYGEGTYRTDLEKEIAALELTNFVHLPGNQKNIFELISDAELFVLPSHYEGMPNALIEAMCLGLPVISTAVSGTSDLIEDGINGRVVPLGDQAALISVMKDLLSDDAQRQEMASQAVSINDKLEVGGIMEQWSIFIEKTAK